MMEIDNMKNPASRASATFFCSSISRRRLCFGVNTSIRRNVITRIAIPKKEYRTEFTNACDIKPGFKLFVVAGTPCIPLLLRVRGKKAHPGKVCVRHEARYTNEYNKEPPERVEHGIFMEKINLLHMCKVKKDCFANEDFPSG